MSPRLGLRVTTSSSLEMRKGPHGAMPEAPPAPSRTRLLDGQVVEVEVLLGVAQQEGVRTRLQREGHGEHAVLGPCARLREALPNDGRTVHADPAPRIRT